MSTQWFEYNGTDPADPNNYTPTTGGTPSCSGTPQRLCGILAENDGSNHPILDLSIALEMVQALEAPKNTTNVKLKQR